MKIIDGNILYITQGVIVHQVNCQGVMGAGIAKSIRSAYPKVYEDYMVEHRHNRLQLGKVIYTIVADRLVVASVCGQQYYGRNKKIIYTDYSALTTGLQNINKFAISWGAENFVYIPYCMGCCLANGDWNTVSSIISETIPTATVVKLSK